MKISTNPSGDPRPYRNFTDQELNDAINGTAGMPVNLAQIDLYNEIVFRWKAIRGFPRSSYWDAEDWPASPGMTVIESKVEALGNGYSKADSPDSTTVRCFALDDCGKPAIRCQDCTANATFEVQKDAPVGVSFCRFYLCGKCLAHQFPLLAAAHAGARSALGSKSEIPERFRARVEGGEVTKVASSNIPHACPSCGSMMVEPWGFLWICRGTLMEWIQRNPRALSDIMEFTLRSLLHQCGTVFAVDQPKAA